ncbi:MAG: histidine triad nucleotide-binding protein [Elusimicrobia bacterium]|nr:histidine triad nucleotide-binding protein [Candidatus Obscuribacterium magneticum]
MDDCIFCKIAAGQIKSTIVYQSETVVAFRDVNPQAPVHVLVIPRKHIEKVVRLEEKDVPLLGELFKAIKSVAESEKITEKGFRVVVNNGREAGQTVDHVHFHVLGGRPMEWPPG